MNHLLYDADCGFCTRTVNRFGRLLRRDVAAQPLQDFASDDSRLQPEELRRSIKLVHGDGRVFSGAEAIARAVGGAALLYYTPGIRQLANGLYAWVARNRHVLAGSCQATSR